MKILIADDDPIPRRLLQATLARWEYEVVVARDGAEAWQLLQNGDDDAPKLAILDWLMPGLDGVDVCRKVRGERPEDAPYVYLLLLTSKDRKEDVVAGLDAGADDYLTKPFDPQELQVRLRAGRRILDLEAALRDSLDEVRRAEAELARAREREGEVGGKIQQTLLLGQPPRALRGLEVAPLTVPSQRIDGDFYDFFLHHERCLDVVVGDVMGKGVAAALLGAAIKSHFLRALGHLLTTTEPGRLPRPEQIVTAVHEDVTRQFIGLERFATLCYARFDLDTRHVTFVDCGHTKTIHFSAGSNGGGGADCTLLQGESMPLGFSERETYAEASAPFAAGDVFFFYSDGVTEAQNEAGEQFGVDRLVECLRTNRDLAPAALIETVRAAVVAYSHSETFADDLTCVAVRIEEEEPVTAASPLVGQIQVPGQLSELAGVRSFVRAFCERLEAPRLAPRRLDRLELAVNEAASNIIRHGYAGRPDGRIEIVADASEPGALRIELRHRGEPFNPAAVPAPAFDGTREGGFGVYLIAQAVDDVRYERDETDGSCRTVLTMKRGDGGGGLCAKGDEPGGDSDRAGG